MISLTQKMPTTILPIHLLLLLPQSWPFLIFFSMPPTLLSSILSSSPLPDLLLFFSFSLSLLIILKPPSSPHLHLRRRNLPPPAMLRRSSTTPFPSPQSLSSFLKPRLPPNTLSSWGLSPGSKTLTNLFLEISSGESSLESDQNPNQALRSLHVAIVKIRNRRGHLLIESHQILSDGSVRERGRPLSEKMKPGENVEEAVLRAVEEELGCGSSVKIMEGSYVVRVEEKESVSYPGLKARYVLHSVEARVERLQEEGEFVTEEIGEGREEEMGVGEAVFVRKHFWKWVDDRSSV